MFLQVPDDELGIGTATRMLVIGQEDDGAIEVERRFFANVRAFYEATVKKLLAKFPFKDKTLSDLKVKNYFCCDATFMLMHLFRLD